MVSSDSQLFLIDSIFYQMSKFLLFWFVVLYFHQSGTTGQILFLMYPNAASDPPLDLTAQHKNIETDRRNLLLSVSLWSYLVRIWAATCVSICVSGKSSLIARAFQPAVYIDLLVKRYYGSDSQIVAIFSMVTDC